MNPLFLLSLMTLAPAAEAPSAAEQPYQVVVCLRVADNPILTPLFVQSVQHQVQDQLAHYFGSIADVQVRSADHWLLEPYAGLPIDRPEITTQMLQEHDATGKLFLVGLDARDGFYYVTWRQIDGAAHQVGPIRARSTPDRQWVAKAVCLVVKDDFALVADVDPGDAAGATNWNQTMASVKVRFRGRSAQSLLRSLLGSRCVLKPFWILRRQSGIQRYAIPDTFLLLDPNEAITKAKVVTNLSNPFPQRAIIAGYDAIRMSTQRGRLRLKLEDEMGQPVIDCRVSANEKGFDQMTERDILAPPDPDGLVLSRGEFNHLAFVKVSYGSMAIKLPVPITADVTERVVRVRTDEKASEKADFRRNVRFLIQDVQTIRMMQAEAVSRFNELNKNKRYEEALKQVEGALDFGGDRLDQAGRTLSRLQDQAQDLDDQTVAPLLKSARQLLGQTQDQRRELRKLTELITDAITTRDAQQRANVLIELGKQAELEGDIDQAIDRYTLALTERKDQPNLQSRLEQLKRDWQLKGPDHEQAHKTIYDRWAKAEVTEIEGLFSEVQKAFNVVKKYGDVLRARRLSAVNAQQLSNLTALVEQLSQRAAEADQAELEQYVTLTEQLAQFQDAVARYVEDALTGAATAAPVRPDDARPSALSDVAEEEEQGAGAAKQAKPATTGNPDPLLDLGDEDQ